MGVLRSIGTARNTARHLQSLRSAARSDTCIIVGNGPSLQPQTVAAVDSSLADVFISNFAYENAALFERANVLGIVNPLVVEQASGGLDETYAAAGAAGKSVPLLLVPESLAWQFPGIDSLVGVTTAPTPGFQTHHSLGASTQSTVTYFLLQVAFWVGYKQVTLIGVDNTYDQPGVVEGVVIKQIAADTNHFSDDYFRGRRWQAADTQRMAAVIAMAAATYSTHGRRLTNSTLGGALDVLPRAPLSEVLDGSTEGAPLGELGRARALGLSVWSLLLHLRSRWKLAIALLATVLLSIVARVVVASEYSVAWAEIAAAGAGVFALLAVTIVAISLRARRTETASVRTFQQLSRAGVAAQH